MFVNGRWSDEALVEVGVPQGSILGPLLILIFVNNFFEFVDPVEHILWADDSNITVKSKDLEQVKELGCVTGSNAQEWFACNKLCCNVEKTEKMLWFLGVHLDPKLTWNEHINVIAKKLSKNIFLIRNLSSTVSTPALGAAYFSLCESRLRYCVTIWGSSSGCDRIFGLQSRAVRILGHPKYREDCTEI